MIGFINAFFYNHSEAQSITTAHNQWPPKTRSILAGLRVSSLLVFLLLWVTWFWFTNHSLVIYEWRTTNDSFFSAWPLIFVQYPWKMFVVCSYPQTPLLDVCLRGNLCTELVSGIHLRGNMCYFRSNTLVSKSLQLPFFVAMDTFV
jgi:hypothetical protein